MDALMEAGYGSVLRYAWYNAALLQLPPGNTSIADHPSYDDIPCSLDPIPCAPLVYHHSLG